MSANISSAATAVEIHLDAQFHSEQAILRACYSLDHLAVFTVEKTDNHHIVHCSPRTDVEDIESQLHSAVIDFSIRESIEARTGQLRDLIWRTAFAELRGAKAG